MKYHFFSFTNAPTPFRLEPTLEEVFHEPEKYAKYFKPILAVDVSQIIPGETGELFFLYTPYTYLASFEVVDGKYQLLDFHDRPVNDLETILNCKDIQQESDEPISAIAVRGPYPAKPNQRYVRIHSFESDLGPNDDDWYDAIQPFEDELFAKGIEIKTEIGHLGGQPNWMQWVDEDTVDYVTGFVGQMSASRWGNFYGAFIYMHLYTRDGRRFVNLEYQYT